MKDDQNVDSNAIINHKETVVVQTVCDRSALAIQHSVSHKIRMLAKK